MIGVATPAPAGGFDAELSRLGLKGAVVREAVGASNAERRLCSKKHAAKIAPGIYAYNGLVTSLSLQLEQDEQDEWERIDLAGVLPIIRNMRTKVALGVTSGNSLTGLRDGKNQPSSRYPKGELTKRLVDRNTSIGQLQLLDRSPFEVAEPVDDLEGFNLWLLLVYFDRKQKEIRYEISLPERLTARGYMREWYHRIIPDDPYKADGYENEDGDPNDGFGPPDIVTVEPR
ncbi:hypothetical protein [Kitasatospora indigofera]|uniref:hypothetical protein n=1 Tax=Kitasatospora indigofera TaxID=67307 RepID=UPI0033BC129D